MKEESPHLMQNNKAEPLLEWELLDKAHSSLNTPKPRFKHQAFIYQNVLYIYGGTTIPLNEPFDDPLDIYKYGLSSNEWQKARLKCNSKDLQVVSGHCGALNGCRWFMFGGTNNDFRSNNYLWRLNLQTLQMNKLQNRGEIPAARDSASLLCIDKNWLLLYGGVNINNVEIYNTFHFYNIENRHWTKCEGPYQYQAYSRFDPALVQANGKLYMFGGTFRNRQNQELYLNDFYEFDIPIPTKGIPPKIAVRRLVSDVMPQARSGHIMTDLGDGYLVVLGGQNSQTKMKDGIKFDDATVVSNAWVYCIQANIWRKISIKNSNRFKFRSQFSISTVETNKYLIFGGIHSYSSISNQLMQVSLVNYHLKSSPKLANCLKCDQKQKFIHREHQISAETIEDIAESIAFPFAAIGLLIDNGINHGATFINLFYHEEIGSQKLKVFRVQDNGKLPWSDEQFFNSMASLSASPSVLPSSTDKKIKMSVLRQNLRMEYGSNCKISSLRLGSGFLHISYSQNGQLIRVCLFKKQEDNKKKSRYILLHYTYSVSTKETTQPEMNTTRKYVQNKYRELIEDALSQCNVRNTLFILEPRIQDFRTNNEEEMQLKVNYSTNDIINGLYSNYIALDRAGYNISDCVDVSLKAYITCLYLKNETTLIALSIKNTDPVSIPTQAYLQKVDKLCKYKHVLQINNVIQFQFKIVQLYYLYDLKKKLNYFNNGLLIYHKNRLISRYKYPLGELIPRKIYKMEGNCNLIRMFGFIELPDHVPVNMFKTNVIHPLMTQKLFSRLKFMNKMFKKELQKMVVDNNYKRFAPTKLSNEEKEQDFKENPEFKAETDVTGKEKNRKSAQKQSKSKRAISNSQPKPTPEFQNQQIKITDALRDEHKDEPLEQMREEQPPVAKQSVGDKLLQQDQEQQMKQVQIEINENQMQNEELSDSSSSSSDQRDDQQIIEQEVEIKYYGSDEKNQHEEQQVVGRSSDQMKQKLNGKSQELNQENGNNASGEIQEQQSIDSKENKSDPREDLRKITDQQKISMQQQKIQIQEEPKQYF